MMYKRNTKGFTLIEMLLAVALFAVVMSSTVGVLRMGLQIWKRTKEVSKGERRIILALEKMGQDLRSTVPIKKSEDKFSIASKQEVEYDGSPSKLAIPILLIADPDNPKSLGGYGRVTYELTPEKELCRKVENASDLFRESNVRCQVLADHITKLQFRYWVATGINGGHAWDTDWNGPEGLPKAVEINAEFKPEDRAAMPKKYQRLIIIPAGADE